MKKALHRILLLTASFVCIFIAQAAAQAFTPTEAAIRKELNIPANAKRVVILSHDAHMDWDWLNPFPYNVNESGPTYNNYFSGTRQPADSILSMATKNLLASSSYYYSVCEVGFLRAFAKNNPALFNTMRASGRLRVVGGGITSPDNLLPNGETFIRDFLVANQWLKQVDVPWSQQVWLPDDFGHDPQLPVILQGMDAMGVGFARIPGACNGYPQAYADGQQTLLNKQTGGVDFRWVAADSSEAVAHWLQSHYNQGSDIESTNGQDFTSLQSNLDCTKSFNSNVIAHMKAYLSTNESVAPTPYIFVEVSDDFMTPYQQIVADANLWNNSPAGYKTTGVYAAVATFDHYLRLVNEHSNLLKLRSYNILKPGSAFLPFKPNPYWMGYYASRPELKTLHNDATRTLLAAESYQVISNVLLPVSSSVRQMQVQRLLNAWDTLAPSTHHDFITGTAVDSVYQNEQLPLLKKALSLGEELKSEFMLTIASNISAVNPSVVVFNPLGFNNSGVIEYQPATGKKMLLNVSAPSLGYNVNNLAAAQKGDGSVRIYPDGKGNFYLQNGALRAAVNMATGNLMEVMDRSNNKQVLASGAIGNEIAFYNDGGDIYRFGYEEDNNCTFSPTQVSWSGIGITFDSLSALQKSITVTKTASAGGVQLPFTITYSVRQGEPFLRMSTTGSAPANYTVMVKFPLNAPGIDNILAGTPYHWNSLTPLKYGTNAGFNSTMWATHDFVIPRSNGNILGAIYHASTPAWTSVSNTLYGVILRNTDPEFGCNGYGADGSDADAHTQEYALRIPSGLALPVTGQPLKEARGYNTPMDAVAVKLTSGGKLLPSYSMAFTSSNAFITAAKWDYNTASALILRVYQPNNARMSSTLSLAPSFTKYSAVSALELPVINAKVKPSVSKSGGVYHLTLPRALSTFKME
jgi:alpha-mannosidase